MAGFEKPGNLVSGAPIAPSLDGVNPAQRDAISESTLTASDAGGGGGNITQADPRAGGGIGGALADEASAAHQMALNYANEANQVLGGHLFNLKGVGSLSQFAERAKSSLRSVSDQISDPESQEDDDIPLFPGGVYIAHLAKRIKGRMNEKSKKSSEDSLNIYTEHMSALKTAIGAIGILSDKNPGGMPIDMKSARKIWFGDKTPDKFQESEWRSLVEMGDNLMDPKRTRRFVNFDGSLTWELLNEDKTVMSRFTMGEYKGSKVFAQGGYNKFAEVLKKAQSELGPDQNAEFSKMRGRLFGGV